MAAMDRVLSRVLYHGSQSPGLELILGFPSSHEIHLIRNPSVDMVDQFMVKLDQAAQRNKSKAGLYSYGNEHSTSKLVGSLIAQAKDIVESEFEGITSDEKKRQGDIITSYLILKRVPVFSDKSPKIFDDLQFALGVVLPSSC